MGRTDHPVDGRILQRNPVDVKFRFLAGADELYRTVNHRQGLQPQKVEFHEADFFGHLHFILGDQSVDIRGVNRNVIHHGTIGHDDAGGMDGRMTRQALQGPYHFQKTSHGVIASGLFRQTRFDFHGVLELHNAFVGNLVRDQFGDAVALGIANLHDTPDVAHRSLGQHFSKCCDLCDIFSAVFSRYVLNDFIAAILAEVDVEVGHGHAFRIQKPLEHQIESNRIQVRDAQGISHERSSTRSPPRSNGNAIVFGPVDKILDDKEITGKAHLQNHIKFKRQSCPVFFFCGCVKLRAVAFAKCHEAFFQGFFGKAL